MHAVGKANGCHVVWLVSSLSACAWTSETRERRGKLRVRAHATVTQMVLSAVPSQHGGDTLCVSGGVER
jgi:hypothetical protein